MIKIYLIIKIMKKIKMKYLKFNKINKMMKHHNIIITKDGFGLYFLLHVSIKNATFHK